MKANLKAPGMRRMLRKFPRRTLRASLRRIGARNARNYMRNCGLLIPEEDERLEREVRQRRRRRLTLLLSLLRLVQ